MTYRFTGLDPARFAHLAGRSDVDLAADGALRMVADAPTGFPCRVTLDDAPEGQRMLLVNHVSHEVNNPYRASHAIFVSEGASTPASYVDAIPPALDRRILSLRAFGTDGLMVDAALAHPGEADPVLRRLFDDPATDHVDAHTATRGCFMARAERFQMARV